MNPFIGIMASMTEAIWDKHVIKTFQRIDKDNTKEKVYYPAYNKLLYSEFPATSDFTVAPQTYPKDTKDSIDYMVEYDEYIVFNEAKSIPVFVLEIKSRQSLDSSTSRELADLQMRQRFAQLIDKYPFDTFYGVSAFGENVCFYSVNKNSGIISPEYIEKSRNRIDNANPPVERWNNNILEEDCARRLKEIFTKIKEYCE